MRIGGEAATVPGPRVGARAPRCTGPSSSSRRGDSLRNTSSRQCAALPASSSRRCAATAFAAAFMRCSPRRTAAMARYSARLDAVQPLCLPQRGRPGAATSAAARELAPPLGKSSAAAPAAARELAPHSLPGRRRLRAKAALSPTGALAGSRTARRCGPLLAPCRPQCQCPPRTPRTAPRPRISWPSSGGSAPSSWDPRT